MSHPHAFLALAALASSLAAQNSLVFTGRFPFTSFDSVNERPNGSINRLEEFDFSIVTPGPGAFARSLQPATAHQAYLGDGNADGNYTKFLAFKTYFQNIQFGGLFMKSADKAVPQAQNVYFTVRSNAAPLQFEAFTTNGTAVAVLRPGDFVRFTGNGNLEYFVTADQLDVAAGPPLAGFSSVKGASAMCQDPSGNLYYSPAQGGQWINGNLGGPFLANDGSIVKIPASAITYDAFGNVAAIAANSAQLLVAENYDGPGATLTSTWQMVLNAQTFARDGTPIVTTATYSRTDGLDFDPNGGTFTADFPDLTGTYTTHPNLLFCSDAGSYAGTIWSTANNGSAAVINGVTCASTTPGVPATGSWLGVNVDLVNFQPTLMGLIVTGAMPYEPLVLDMPNFGAIQNNGTQTTIDIDVHGSPINFIVLLADFNMPAIGGFAPSVPTQLLPLSLNPFSHFQAFPLFTPTDLGVQLTDGNGYASYSLGNPHAGQFAGIPMILQAGALDFFGTIQVSNPVMSQFK